MERRRFPRQDIRQLPLKATIVISGESLLKEDTPRSVEIDAKPVNISQSGICLSLRFDGRWNTLLPDKEIELFLQRGRVKQSLKGKIVHILEGGQMLGLQFCHTLNNMDHLVGSSAKKPLH